MNARTCTSIIRRIFIVYCLVGYQCPDFAPIYHDSGGCPDFYFSSLKTLDYVSANGYDAGTNSEKLLGHLNKFFLFFFKIKI